MTRTRSIRRHSRRTARPRRARLQVERLETRNLLSSGLTLTPLVQVSGASPLPPFVNPAPPTPPTVFNNSEVEPQIAVDPTNTDHAVAVWQQDRYRSVGGARALGFSVTYNASDGAGATWSAPAVIPGFDGTDPDSPWARYTDPWVSIAPDGTVYASALALTPTGPLPGHTAVLVSQSTDGGNTWGTPTILFQIDAPAGTDPIDGAVDKESVTADPTDANYAYVVWDQLQHPGDEQNFNAAHSLAFRGDALFARTTDGGLTWEATRNLTNFQSNEFTIGNQIVVQPDGTLVDIFTHQKGSGGQPPQADQSHVGVLLSTDHGATWSGVIDGPALEVVPVSDPDTGAAVRAGEVIFDVAVDPNNGNIYAAWTDARFSSKYSYDSIAFSMSTDGGLTWSTPIKVNQTPTGISAGNQQAFTPNVAVAADGTVAVTYYDFRNNTSASGLTTDYWIVAGDPTTDPSTWTEAQLTPTSGFNMENAARTSRGYFLGDYNGLEAAGNNFYALFAQAGSGASDPSNIWFRDPPPAEDAATTTSLAETTTREKTATGDDWSGLDIRGLLARETGAAWSDEQATDRNEKELAPGGQNLPFIDPDTSSALRITMLGGSASTGARDHLFAGLGDEASEDGLGGDLSMALDA